MGRILPVSSICSSLWSEESLRLSSQLAGEYLARLSAQGLLELASDQTLANGEPGGATREDADRHFALRFTNSVGRSMCAALDPHDKLGFVSNSLLSPMLAERVLIVDIPCGAGAGGVALLDCIREIRCNNLLPRLPLSALIVAGDISDRAREHYREIFESLRDGLSAAFIDAELFDFDWDVSDTRSNARFVDAVVAKAADVDQVLVIASNFSDAMANEELFEYFSHFLSQLIGRLADWQTTVCWVEPKSNKARKYLPPILGWAKRFTSWLKFSDGGVLECDYQMTDPIKDKCFRSGITVLQCSAKAPV